MQAYYDEYDYPLPKVEAPEMESQIVQSDYLYINMIISYEYNPKDTVWYSVAKNRKDLDSLIHSRHCSSRIAYTDVESCSLVGVKISMAKSTSIKIMSMSIDELLAEYENLE